MTSHSGGCQCGAVRYRVDGPLNEPHLCHCRMCQKAAGNYFMPLAGAGPGDLVITRGEPAWFASSAPVRRGFCRDCGTPLFFGHVEGGYVAVTLGSLDDPAAVKPLGVYGIEARMPWIAEVCAMEGTATEDDPGEGPEHLAQIRATNRQHPDRDTDRWPPEGQDAPRAPLARGSEGRVETRGSTLQSRRDRGGT